MCNSSLEPATAEAGKEAREEEKMSKLTDRELMIAGFAYRCAEHGDNIQMMESRLYAMFDGKDPEPPHQTGCICADCSGAELTADND